ncbi:hypothetical protein V8167_001561 [Providencia rettgeri]|nr:hypothetical protein [Providencia rettgeri]
MSNNDKEIFKETKSYFLPPSEDKKVKIIGNVVLSINTTEIEKQINEMCNALTDAFVSLESIHDDTLRCILDRFELASLDIVSSHGAGAFSADSSYVITCLPRFGVEFERLITAIRAGEFNGNINTTH